MLDYLVLYSSETGNTKQVANEIFNAIPGTSKELLDIKDYHYDKDAKLYFVGFRTHKGTCDMNILSFLGSLHEKRIALFGTCGMGKNEEYFHTIVNNVSVFISDDCELMGSYICQGKMPASVKQKYEAMLLSNPEESQRITAMISNYDEASKHPTDEDLVGAQSFVSRILNVCI